MKNPGFEETLRDAIERTVTGSPIKLGRQDGVKYLVDALEMLVVERLSRAFGTHYRLLSEVGNVVDQEHFPHWEQIVSEIAHNDDRTKTRANLAQIAATAISEMKKMDEVSPT